MAKYCARCNYLVDRETGLCPRCDAEKLRVLQLCRNPQPVNPIKFPKAVVVALLLLLAAGSILFLFSKIVNPSQKEQQALQETVPTIAAMQPMVIDALYNDSLVNGSAMYDYLHIPQITLKLPQIEATNDYIYDKTFSYVQPDVFLGTSYSIVDRVSYSWGTNGKILSILIHGVGLEPFYNVYNVSLETGAIVYRDDALESFGLTQQQYYNLVRKSKIAEKLVASENTEPYIDSATGDLCFISGTRLGNATGSSEPYDPCNNPEYPSWQSLTGSWVIDKEKTETVNSRTMQQIWGADYKHSSMTLYDDGVMSFL